MTSVRVIVADDQTVVREGLALILGLLPDVIVVGTAANGEEALGLGARERPEVVFMDPRMPRMDGVQATKRICAGFPDTRVVVLTTYSDDESVLAALGVGAHGYLTKNARSEDLAQAITDVLGGDSHLDPAVQRRLVELAITDRRPGPSDGLTPRELQVLRLIAEGRSNSEIARQLYIAEGTVKTHLNNLFAKARVRDRAQAVTYPFRHGLASTPNAP